MCPFNKLFKKKQYATSKTSDTQPKLKSPFNTKLGHSPKDCHANYITSVCNNILKQSFTRDFSLHNPSETGRSERFPRVDSIIKTAKSLPPLLSRQHDIHIQLGTFHSEVEIRDLETDFVYLQGTPTTIINHFLKWKS